jgi:hypothetical protein
MMLSSEESAMRFLKKQKAIVRLLILNYSRKKRAKRTYLNACLYHEHGHNEEPELCRRTQRLYIHFINMYFHGQAQASS